MDRRQIEYFLAVVDYGSMSRAADHLQVSQPSVSQTIRSLERRVGSSLFERRSGRLVITQAGSALVGPARQVVREFLAAERAVSKLLEVEAGRLDLAIPAILALFPTVQLLRDFSSQHPNIVVHVEDQTAVNAVWESVSTGRSEIGLVTTLEDTEMKAVLLGRQYLVAVFPPGTPRCDVPVTLDELAATDWISGPPLGFPTRLAFEQAMARRGLRSRSIIVTAHRQTIPRLVLAGVAPALLIAEEAEELVSFGAVVRPTEPVFDRPYYLIHRRERLSSAAQAFLETALRSSTIRHSGAPKRSA